MQTNEMLGGRFGFQYPNSVYQINNCFCQGNFVAGAVGYAWRRGNCDTCNDPVRSIYAGRHPWYVVPSVFPCGGAAAAPYERNAGEERIARNLANRKARDHSLFFGPEPALQEKK